MFIKEYPDFMEGFRIVIKDNPSNEQMSAMFAKYNNVEIMETCEACIVEVKRISDKELEVIKKFKDAQGS